MGSLKARGGAYLLSNARNADDELIMVDVVDELFDLYLRNMLITGITGVALLEGDVNKGRDQGGRDIFVFNFLRCTDNPPSTLSRQPFGR